MAQSLVTECADVMHTAYERAAIAQHWLSPRHRLPFAALPPSSRAVLTESVSELLQWLHMRGNVEAELAKFVESLTPPHVLTRKEWVQRAAMPRPYEEPTLFEVPTAEA